MSEQQQKIGLEQQRQTFIARFSTALTIASKPLNDLVEAFSGYVQTTNALLAEKNMEIMALKGRVMKEVNRDVPVPAASLPQGQSHGKANK